MQNATYRGVEYIVNNEPSAPVDRLCYYRGAAYNPAKQEIQPETAKTLIYRGAEYTRGGGSFLALTQARAVKANRLASARLAFTRNLGESSIV